MMVLSQSATCTSTTSGLPARRSTATASYSASSASSPASARALPAATVERHTTAHSVARRMGSCNARPVPIGLRFVTDERGRLLDEVARLFAHEHVVEREARQGL